MTAPTITDTDTDLDPAPLEQLQPPCEIVLTALCLAHGAHTTQCEEPAAFSAKLQCGCDQPYIALICSHHVHHLALLRRLMVHGPCAQGITRVISVEALR